MGTCLFFVLGWISTLSGVLLGGWLVYRTKREPYDALFAGQQKGEAFNIDDELNTLNTEPSSAQMSASTQKMNDKFVDQFASRLAGQAVEVGAE